MIEQYFDIGRLAAGLGLAIILALIAYRLKALTSSGSFGASLMGTLVLGFGGWLYAVPIVFFFVSSSVLSRLKSDIKLSSREMLDNAGPRDISQVLANGGVASICLLALAVTGTQVWFYLYLASLGAATADTWATEIGTLWGKRPVSIINFKPVQPGSSGGISVPGTLAALAGSIATVFSVFPFINGHTHISLCLAAAIAGFLGSILDSVMGASIQAVYKCRVCGALIEFGIHCGEKAELVKGLSIINNDMVNFLSNLIAVTLLALLIR